MISKLHTFLGKLSPNTRILLCTVPLVAFGVVVLGVIYVVARYLYLEAYGPYNPWESLGLYVGILLAINLGMIILLLDAVVALTCGWWLRKKLPQDAKHLVRGGIVLLIPGLLWYLFFAVQGVDLSFFI